MKQGKTIFDELWKTSVTIVDAEHLTEFKDKFIKHIWLKSYILHYLGVKSFNVKN